MRMSLMYDAKRGHLKSQYDLATMYLTGEGMPQDDKKAAKWYTIPYKPFHNLSDCLFSVSKTRFLRL